MPDPPHKFAWATDCVQHMCTHAHTRTQTHAFTELPVKQPNQGLNGTWKQRGTTLPQQPSRNS